MLNMSLLVTRLMMETNQITLLFEGCLQFCTQYTFTAQLAQSPWLQIHQHNYKIVTNPQTNAMVQVQLQNDGYTYINALNTQDVVQQFLVHHLQLHIHLIASESGNTWLGQVSFMREPLALDKSHLQTHALLCLSHWPSFRHLIHCPNIVGHGDYNL